MIKLLFYNYYMLFGVFVDYVYVSKNIMFIDVKSIKESLYEFEI